MNSCSGSVRSFYDEDETTPLNEKLDDYDCDNGSETSEAWSYQKSGSLGSMLPSYPLARILRSGTRLAFALLPTFLQAQLEEDNDHRVDRLHPTAYLDGMRGLAAFAVFLCHLSYGTYDLTHSYGAGDSEHTEENKSLLQLPIVRLLYSGPPMVAIFFVISGYVLSYKPLKQMRGQDYEGLMHTLTSSVFRRALRLFLPCLASTFIVACLAQLGCYKLTEDFAHDMRATQEDHAWTAPNPLMQLTDWMHKMLDFINVFDWNLYAGSIDLDRHLWTIPVEFRCSMALFVTHILVGRMTPRLRLATLTFSLGWGTYWNRWELLPFWAGAILAEKDLIQISHKERLDTCFPKEAGSPRATRSFWQNGISFITFIVGLFLASYPDAEGHVSPGYVWLTMMIPDRYTEKHRFWPNVGAVMIVWGASNLPSVKRVFTSSLMQYLGRISFPLYVCHGFVIHTVGYMAFDWIWNATGGYDDRQAFDRGFAIVALMVIGVTVWVSDIFLRVVDTRCVRFAKWLEGGFFAT